MIKLSDFINVNIETSDITSTEQNKVVVYICGGSVGSSKIYTSYSEELKRILTDAGKKFCEQFFKCAGQSLRVMILNTSTISDQQEVNKTFLSALDSLNLNEVAFAFETGTSPQYSMGSVGSSTGILDLINKLYTLSSEGSSYRKLGVIQVDNINNAFNSKNLICKYTTQTEDVASVLAYLSRVSLNDSDSIKGYGFTKELTCKDMSSELSTTTWTDIKNNLNTDIALTGSDICNFGGNTSAGTDIMQEYMSIYISQEILYAEWNLLKNKIQKSYGSEAVHNAIINVLEKYYDSGYLVPAVYEGNTIYEHVNGSNVEILKDGEMITAGYKIMTLPSTSSDSHSLPKVVIILNTDKGINYINNIGTIL